MIENEYSRQEDSYKQQIADLEEEKEQLQVSLSTCSYTSLNGNLPAQILFTVKLEVLLDRNLDRRLCLHCLERQGRETRESMGSRLFNRLQSVT